MQNARTDLAREYEVLHQPEKAAQFRSYILETTKSRPPR